MKTDTLELISGAVFDVVMERLPGLILEAVKSHMPGVVAPAALAAIQDHERQIIAGAVAATMKEHETRIAEFRRLDETVLSAMREELNRLRAEFDDGLAKHYAEVRRELAHETATTIATALMDRREGPPGPPGRDGTLSAAIHWTAGARVARGSCVQHKGGLWFANVDTDVEPGAPCSGYSLMLDGCEPSFIEPDERGYLALVCKFASGTEKKIPLHFRPMQYAGVWDCERDYLPGDMITSDGSLWLARATNSALRPGTDKGAQAWQLIVKRGKDGAPGERGPQGERGPPGESPAPRKRTTGNGAHA